MRYNYEMHELAAPIYKLNYNFYSKILPKILTTLSSSERNSKKDEKKTTIEIGEG